MSSYQLVIANSFFQPYLEFITSFIKKLFSEQILIYISESIKQIDSKASLKKLFVSGPRVARYPGIRKNIFFRGILTVS